MPHTKKIEKKKINEASDQISDFALWMVGEDFLSGAQLYRLALASPKRWAFFQPHRSVIELIQHIHNANYKAISRLITKNPELMFTRIYAPFFDEHSEKISPLQYAIKILDNYLVHNFFDFIHGNKQHVAQFIYQAAQQKKHINFSELFQAYAEFFKAFGAFRAAEITEEDLKPAYLKLGMSQRKHLPVYLIKLMFQSANWTQGQQLNIKPSAHNCMALNVETNQFIELVPYKENQGLGYEFALLSIRSYQGVISKSAGFHGSESKGLFELHQQDLQLFQTQAESQLKQIIQKALDSQKDDQMYRKGDEEESSTTPSYGT